MDYAIVIGVEHYQDKSIPQVEYAEVDATAVEKALGDLGFTSEILVSSKATKTTIESVVRRVARAVTEDDSVYLFYAAHGFSKNDKNFLTCHDTQLGDIAHTSIELQKLFDSLRKSAAKRVVVFLDACESGMFTDLSVRGVFSALNDQELKKFFSDAEFYVCFSSCKADESSYSHGTVEHGIWTHHLLEVLTGSAPLGMERGGFVTVTSLQNYLAREVPKTVRSVRTGLDAQTPWACGAMSKEFVVADLRDLLRARAQAKVAAAKEMTQATLSGRRSQAVKRLSGFRKGHRVPESANNATNNFVASIGGADLKTHLDTVYGVLRDELGYKRRDLVDRHSGGSGTIQTPDFEYNVRLFVDPEDPSMVVWVHEVSRISNQEVVLSEGFESALGEHLDTLEYELATTFDLDDFIDRIEEDEPDGVHLDYARGSSECELRLDGFDGVLRLTPGSIVVTGLKRPTPKALVEAFAEAGKLLAVKAPLALP